MVIIEFFRGREEIRQCEMCKILNENAKMSFLSIGIFFDPVAVFN
jgi:hypothetical protein